MPKKRKHQKAGRRTTSYSSKKEQTSIQPGLPEEEKIQLIVRYWIRRLKIKIGWINDFDKLVVNYVMFFAFLNFKYLFNVTTFFMFETFSLSSKLLKTFIGHLDNVHSIDYSTFDNRQLLCSGSDDKKVCVWDFDNNEPIKSFDGHSDCVYCVRFSPYHYHNRRQNVICSSSFDSTIRFWDIKSSQQLQLFNKHADGICGIEFSPFNGGRYLFSGSWDKTVRLWDVETSKSLRAFNGHKEGVWCVDVSPLQSGNGDKSNSIGIIGGNGYTICSGSYDYTIRIWDVETTKQLIIFKGHKYSVNSVKYGSNVLGSINTILSGSADESVRLWDIRSGQQIQVFNGHKMTVTCVEYSPFIINNCGNSNVICSGSSDNTIRFWDIRSNKNELHAINGDDLEDNGIKCLKFMQLKKKGDSNEQTLKNDCGVQLCYGSSEGLIRVCG
ncbi:WD-40 repeat-containing protein [Reticulomyxa filosa]|uniref:WD-40 repeat-containing protein n=1 Tax=Reticulomyxa filosa TaxID=46433 RepID=X6P5W5_RETFI|nr:WD-40 repeat-containing protein [Reticulomyxa filosa]|eukprot:ETO33007.1 WD-40 repeat-containing protein [Reticulomyxa filosa]